MTENNELIAPPPGALTLHIENVSQRGLPVKTVIEMWLDEKYTSGSQSEKTAKVYRTTIEQFREALQEYGKDLFFEDEHYRALISDFAQAWAKVSKKGGKVSQATYAQRIAALSSFYKFAHKRQHTHYENPMLLVDRPKIDPYANAHAIPLEEIEKRLSAIKTDTLKGARDLAILTTLLMTGRRASEIAALRRKHLEESGQQIILHFPRLLKGKKSITDKLDPDSSQILRDWIEKMFGPDEFWKMEEDAPIWVDLQHRKNGLRPIGYQTLSSICEFYLEDSRVHTTRHSFARGMIKANAPVTVIMEKLAHSDLGTTGIYVKEIGTEENIYAPDLATRMGLHKLKKS